MSVKTTHRLMQRRAEGTEHKSPEELEPGLLATTIRNDRERGSRCCEDYSDKSWRRYHF